MDLPDVNVWLAFGLPDHEHHPRARHYWFEDSAEEVTETFAASRDWIYSTCRPEIPSRRGADAPLGRHGGLPLRQANGFASHSGKLVTARLAADQESA